MTTSRPSCDSIIPSCDSIIFSGSIDLDEIDLYKIYTMINNAKRSLSKSSESSSKKTKKKLPLCNRMCSPEGNNVIINNNDSFREKIRQLKYKLTSKKWWSKNSEFK